MRNPQRLRGESRTDWNASTGRQTGHGSCGQTENTPLAGVKDARRGVFSVFESHIQDELRLWSTHEMDLTFRASGTVSFSSEGPLRRIVGEDDAMPAK